MNIQVVHLSSLRAEILKRIVQAGQVVDIGCGICPQNLVEPQLHLCVEPHKTYVDTLQSLHGSNDRLLVINATWDQAMALLPSKSVDAVYALDFIEHLSKEDGIRFVREAERVARRQIVISTPLGFYPQSYSEPGQVDRWGLDGTEWQHHKSGWLPEDFSPEWQFVICQEYFLSDQDGAPLPKPHGVLWALRTWDRVGEHRWSTRLKASRERLVRRLFLAAQRRLPIKVQLLIRRGRATLRR